MVSFESRIGRKRERGRSLEGLFDFLLAAGETSKRQADSRGAGWNGKPSRRQDQASRRRGPSSGSPRGRVPGRERLARSGLRLGPGDEARDVTATASAYRNLKSVKSLSRLQFFWRGISLCQGHLGFVHLAVLLSSSISSLTLAA